MSSIRSQGRLKSDDQRNPDNQTRQPEIARAGMWPLHDAPEQYCDRTKADSRGLAQASSARVADRGVAQDVGQAASSNPRGKARRRRSNRI
jgi:hypothetical protein